MSNARRPLLVAWAHLAVLWAFAFAQPLLDLVGESPEFFVARGNTRGDILVLAFALVLVPPTALVLLEAPLLRVPRARAAVHLAFVATLTAAIALQALKSVFGGIGAPAAFIGALVLGAGGALLYARSPGVRSFLTVLAPVPAVVIALFLLISPVSELILPQKEISAAGLEGGHGAPVVMIVFDEMSGASLLDRDLRIDASRYPHIAELARRSTWYRNATTVDYATQRAVPALLTGTRPPGDSLPIASDHPRNLFTMLGERYDLDVHEAATELCPERLCGQRERAGEDDRLRSLADDLRVVSLHLLLPDEVADDLPAVDATFEGFRDTGGSSAGHGAASVPERAFRDRPALWSRFVERLDAGQTRPDLHFLHIALPHWPYQYLPSGQEYSADTSRIPGIDGSSWTASTVLVRQAYQRYLLQLGFVDRLVGRLIARLDAEGLWDRSLVVVAADHGVSFRPEQPRRYATDRNFPDIASVPLFIKAPGQRRGRVDDSPAETVDVLPTIAELLGLDAGWRFDGRSLRHGAGERRTVAVLSGAEHRKPFAVFRRMRDREVARRIRLFGARAGAGRLYGMGAHSALLGRRPDDLPAGAPGSARAEVDDLPLLAQVDPTAPLLPALASGGIDGTMRPGTTLALALNGRVRAVTAAYTEDGRLRFSALLPPAAFRRGTNRLAVYAVSSGDRPALVAVSQAAPENVGGRLRTDGGVRLELPGRSPIRIRPGAVSGYVETQRASDSGHLSVSGWAADPGRRARVRQVLVVVDGRVLASTTPSAPRLDLTKRYGPQSLRAGYRVSVPLLHADRVAQSPERIRVFGVLGARASELPRLPSPGDG